jgi:hypothetical protein
MTFLNEMLSIPRITTNDANFPQVRRNCVPFQSSGYSNLGPSPPRFEGGRSVPPGFVTLKFLTPSEVAAVMLNVAVIVVELTTVKFVTMMLG